MKMDPVSIAAGLLHDSVEDTSVTVEIRRIWRAGGAHRRRRTKISKIDFSTTEEAQAENLRR
jgi:GTP pyrophosphokinase